MRYTEKLDWILDKIGGPLWSEEKARQNIEFVHSLGLKCDTVGWSTLDLTSPRVEEILSTIERFCKENGWCARGVYTRQYAGESDWYELCFAQAKEGFFCDSREVPDEHGGMVNVRSVKAYQELSPVPRWFSSECRLVPERFRDVCVQQGWTDVEFCWAQDKGKYDAHQYFHIYPRHAAAHMTDSTRFGYELDKLGPGDVQSLLRMQQLGGSLPRLTRTFYRLDVSLPTCYLAAELPAGGFSSAYMPPRREGWTGVQRILVHRERAEVLVRSKTLQPAMLKPVPVLDAFPVGYLAEDRTVQPIPAQFVREELFRAYTALKATERPVRLVTEKEALKLLRSAKKSRKEDFGKAMPKAKAALLADTAYAPLVPYYQIVGSGYLSDEYELLPHERAAEETAAFRAEMEAEELLEEKPDGVVFARCPDGDRVLLQPDGAAIRFSHEAPEAVNTWPDLPQFMADAVNEE